MLRAIKVRLYPNKQQEQALNKVLGCYRFVYNHMLARKQEAYNTDKTNLSLNELSKYFHHELRKNEQYAWLKEQNTQVMGQSIRQMLTAYDKFFKEHKGFPKFKSKRDEQSALFPLNAISKKKVGSNNRNKQRIKMAKVFEHMTNKKENYIHYIVNELLSSYDTIYMEDLSVSGMLKNHHLAKAISEVGFYKFKEILKSKAIANDKQVVLIDKFYPSSKTCSCCGYVYKELTLNERKWQCPNCGANHDRDFNAALNILHEGQRINAA